MKAIFHGIMDIVVCIQNILINDLAKILERIGCDRKLISRRKKFIRTILIMNLTNTKPEDIFKRVYAFKLTILILGIAIFFLGTYSYLSDNLVLLCSCAVLMYFLLALKIYANYLITSQMREILFTMTDLDKVSKIF